MNQKNYCLAYVSNDSADISQSSFNKQNLFSEVSSLRIFNRRNFQFESTSFPINVLTWVLKRCCSCGSQPNCTGSTCKLRIFNNFPFMFEVLVSSYSPMLPFKLSSKIPLWLQLHALLWYSDNFQSFSIPPISVFYELQYYDWRFNSSKFLHSFKIHRVSPRGIVLNLFSDLQISALR
jgi:hypothetical protein